MACDDEKREISIRRQKNVCGGKRMANRLVNEKSICCSIKIIRSSGIHGAGRLLKKQKQRISRFF